MFNSILNSLPLLHLYVPNLTLKRNTGITVSGPRHVPAGELNWDHVLGEGNVPTFRIPRLWVCFLFFSQSGFGISVLVESVIVHKWWNLLHPSCLQSVLMNNAQKYRKNILFIIKGFTSTSFHKCFSWLINDSLSWCMGWKIVLTLKFIFKLKQNAHVSVPIRPRSNPSRDHHQEHKQAFLRNITQNQSCFIIYSSEGIF